MKTIAVRFARSLPFSVLLFLLVAAMPVIQAQAQNTNQSTQADAQSNMISITVVRVKPEMDTAFRNLMRAKTNPALRRSGMKWRDVWQTASFGNLFEYFIVAPIDNLAQYDSPPALERALGKAGYEAWRLEVGRMINDARTFAARYRPDLSYETELTAPPKLGVVTFYHVMPGRSADFEETFKNDILPVIKRSTVKNFWVQQTAFGGDVNEYITLALQENFADVDKGSPVIRVLGQERGMELMRNLSRGNVSHIERMIIRFVPELSFRQTQTTNR